MGEGEHSARQIEQPEGVGGVERVRVSRAKGFFHRDGINTKRAKLYIRVPAPDPYRDSLPFPSKPSLHALSVPSAHQPPALC